MRGADARGRGVPGRVRREQALQFRRSLSPRAGGGTASARGRHAAHRLFAHCGRSHGCALRDRTQGPGYDKGRAIAAFLSQPAFRGRTPIFVGDDTTDESGFAVVAARGGYAYSVGRPRPGAIGVVRRAARGPRLARRIRRSRGRRMTERRQTKSQNLDLALIGNSCSAALVDRNARIVWWCFPYFDSDPVFSRLLADDEEKGFCEVTLADLVETEFALCAQHRDRRDDPDRRARRQSARLRFRATVRALRTRVPAAADHPPHRAARRPAAHRDSRQADAQLRASDDEHRRRLQSHSLYRRRRRSCV